jgi:hypothetical protein
MRPVTATEANTTTPVPQNYPSNNKRKTDGVRGSEQPPAKPECPGACRGGGET